MNGLPALGRVLVLAGVALAAAGLALMVLGRLPGLGRFPLGRLPGDILIKRENFVFYFPLTTGLLVSAVLTLLFRLFGRR
ncbi:MAG: DUF2905 domain-containing protein [Chitinophagales bacterium]